MQKRVYLNLFIVSFVLMGLEMTATRLIAPSFGNTVYTWGIVISVFLIGSSIGYMIGGFLADRSSGSQWMFWLYLLGMLLIGMIPVIKNSVFPFLEVLTSVLGTTVGVLILYFIPNILFSIIATMLMKDGLEEVVTGKVIGNLHTSSALGSVLGTLVTTFLLIPFTDIHTVIATLVGMLFVAFLIYFYLHKKIKILLLFLPTISVLLPFVPDNLSSFGLLYEETSLYHDIQVYETDEFEGVPGEYRYLTFGNDDTIQGIMNMEAPETLLLEYTQHIWEVVDSFAANSDRIFMVGHGIGSLTSKFESEIEEVRVAELDKGVLEASKKYFLYKGNSVEIGDGRKILQEQSKLFDVIVLDAYHDTRQIPFHLITQEFFTLTKEKLQDDGLLVINAIGRPKDDLLIESMYTTIKSVYQEMYILAERDEDELQNLIFIGANDPLDMKKIEGLNDVEVKEGELILDGNTKLMNLN
ncbi:fused MFS/spermidine synthase [Mesobacillus foraminis]|uniref:fused MFS/spermidine synthase n=2 Tax=Mesobacillus foraminis TaxID=279826 RepID=UPI001050C936|nr:fused MFS/spermidine synthase [Mesobacillus foraminis]